MSAATTPPTSSKSTILTGRAVCSICPNSPRPGSMAAQCPTGSAGAMPSDQLATTSAHWGFTTRNRVPRCAPSSSPASRATAVKTSSGGGSLATNVATRRKTACSRTSCSNDPPAGVTLTKRL